MKPEAQEFAVALRSAMVRRNVGLQGLADAVGTSASAVSQWSRGLHLPLITTAERLSDALLDPTLSEIVIRKRTMLCRNATCQRRVVRQGNRRVYCSPACRQLVSKGVSTRSREPARQEAIDAYCRSCEPEGICHTIDCPLRAFSPLPFAPAGYAPVARVRHSRWGRPLSADTPARQRWRQQARDRVA